jgi:hypothetical protein
MRRRPLRLLPFIALFGAATAACGSASTGTPAGPVTSTAAAAAAAVPASAKHHGVAPRVTKTVTVTVTRTVTARPTTARSTPAPTASAPSFAAFTGEWIGHTRTVTVSRRGRLVETVGDGCCDPIIDLVLQLSSPRRDRGHWVATSRVISATVHDGWSAYGRPVPKRGDRGSVTIGADHILVESISSNGFCDPEKTEPGTCGA